MQKIIVVMMVLLGVLAALLLGGAEILGYSGFGLGSGMMSQMGASIAPWFLYVVIGFGLLTIFWLSRTRSHAGVTARNSTSALDISKTRYAKGEITKEQYDTIKHDLGK